MREKERERKREKERDEGMRDASQLKGGNQRRETAQKKKSEEISSLVIV